MNAKLDRGYKYKYSDNDKHRQAHLWLRIAGVVVAKGWTRSIGSRWTAKEGVQEFEQEVKVKDRIGVEWSGVVEASWLGQLVLI